MLYSYSDIGGKIKTKEKTGKCVVCGGALVEKIVNKFDATHGPQIIGPAGKAQWYGESEGYHCKRCGLKYEFLPPDADLQKNQSIKSVRHTKNLWQS